MYGQVADMLHAVKLYFSGGSTGLIILKYLGLSLAAGSSVWATVTVLTVTTADGRRRLTTAGAVSIMITILGLVISIVSEDVQRRQAAISQAAQISAEAKRTNDIIIAGQPLTSLTLTWKFQGLGPDLVEKLEKGHAGALAFIEDQQGERDNQQNSAVFRENQLYPYLLALAREFTNDAVKDEDSNVAVLVALDDAQNSVLPFGFLGQEKPWLRAAAGKILKHKSPPSLEIGNHGDLGNSDLLNWPNLQVDNPDVTIAWYVDPSTFAKSLNRQNDFIVPTAKCPSLLRIAILFDIKELPFTPGNFALAEDQDFWKFPNYHDRQNEQFRGTVGLITKNFSSSVQLIPNSSLLVTYNYSLNQIYESLFLDSYGEANSNLRCLVFEYKLEG
jgi:hypothetical protein